MSTVQLGVKLGGLKLANPTLLASGVLGPSLSDVLKALDRGAGATVTKSIGLLPRKGYEEPTMVKTEAGLLNAVGLPGQGAERFAEELAPLKGKSLPLIVSVFGSTPSEFARIVEVLDGSDFAAYELNLSCPHVEGVGSEVGHDPEKVASVVRATKSRARKPVFAKLSPNTEKLVEVATAARDAGVDGLTAINTVKAMEIDAQTGRPSLSNGYGGLSGSAIRPIALRCVYELSGILDLPIIGCGGISSWEHAVRFFLAGASAIQVGTAAMGNLALFNEINLGVLEYIASKGYAGVETMVGLAHRRVLA